MPNPMRWLLAGAALLAAVPASAQNEPAAKFYHLNPERHGVSWFAQQRHPQVQYEAGETLTFDRYHTVDVMYAWLQRWAERHPEIVEVYEVGRSYEGRPIMQMTLTNKSTAARKTSRQRTSRVAGTAARSRRRNR